MLQYTQNVFEHDRIRKQAKAGGIEPSFKDDEHDIINIQNL